MPKLTITVDLDNDQFSAVNLDKAFNLFAKETLEEFLTIRLLEYINSVTQTFVYQPEEHAAVEVVRQARKGKKDGAQKDSAVNERRTK